MEFTNIELKTGEIYNVYSQRKGKFQMLVNDIDDDFVHGIVISGKAKAIMKYNEANVCDEVSVRKSLTTFQSVATEK